MRSAVGWDSRPYHAGLPFRSVDVALREGQTEQLNYSGVRALRAQVCATVPGSNGLALEYFYARVTPASVAPVAQLDRASDYGSEG